MPNNYESFVSFATIKSFRHDTTLSHTNSWVASLNEKLKRIREEARLTQAQVAEHLGKPTTTYVAKEDPKKFKAKFLPVELARKLADLYAQHGIDRARVMALTGHDYASLPPVADAPQELESRRSVLLPVSLPSEKALTTMFEVMLQTLPAELDRQTLPQALAELLPASLASAAGEDQIPAPARGGTKARPRSQPRRRT